MSPFDSYLQLSNLLLQCYHNNISVISSIICKYSCPFSLKLLKIKFRIGSHIVWTAQTNTEIIVVSLTIISVYVWVVLKLSTNSILAVLTKKNGNIYSLYQRSFKYYYGIIAPVPDLRDYVSIKGKNESLWKYLKVNWNFCGNFIDIENKQFFENLLMNDTILFKLSNEQDNLKIPYNND